MTVRTTRACYVLAFASVLVLCTTMGPPARAAEPDAKDAKEAKASEGPSEEDKAQERLLASIRVLQQRPFLHAVRLEIQALGGIGLADTMYHHYMISAQARIHITEDWSIGGGYSHYFNDTTALHDTVVDNYELFPERSITRFYAGIDAAYNLIYAKSLAFDGPIVHFDLYLLFGGGVTQTTRSADPHPTGMIGLGWRILFTRWFTVALEIRDHIYGETFNRGGTEVVNNVIFQGGITFFIPFDYDYSYPK